MNQFDYYVSPRDRKNRLLTFIKGAPIPLLFGILVPALLTCGRPNGQDMLFDWQRQIVAISYYVMCMIYLFMSFKNALEGKFPRALAYILAPICAAVITATKPDSCTLLNHWRDVMFYDVGISHFF